MDMSKEQLLTKLAKVRNLLIENTERYEHYEKLNAELEAIKPNIVPLKEIPDNLTNQKPVDGKMSTSSRLAISFGIGLIIAIALAGMVDRFVRFYFLYVLIGVLIVTLIFGSIAYFIVPAITKKFIKNKQQKIADQKNTALEAIKAENAAIEAQNKSEIEQANNAANLLKEQIEDTAQKFNETSAEIKSICTEDWYPPDYLCVDAVDNFVGSFKNHQATTIGEAVTIYKQYQHDKEMELQALKQTQIAQSQYEENLRHNRIREAEEEKKKKILIANTILTGISTVANISTAASASSAAKSAASSAASNASTARSAASSAASLSSIRNDTARMARRR